MFKRLTAGGLDDTYAGEMRRLQRVELLIIDDLGLHRVETVETGDFYELIVERHRTASTITTSNREPPELLAMPADPLLAQSAIEVCKVPPSSSSSRVPPIGNNKSPPAHQHPGTRGSDAVRTGRR